MMYFYNFQWHDILVIDCTYIKVIFYKNKISKNWICGWKKVEFFFRWWCWNFCSATSCLLSNFISKQRIWQNSFSCFFATFRTLTHLPTERQMYVPFFTFLIPTKVEPPVNGKYTVENRKKKDFSQKATKLFKGESVAVSTSH